MSASEKILRILGTEVYLDIATTCLNEPKAVRQIAETMGYKLVNVGRWIQQLEEAGILEFTENGWKTSREAANVIKKYFT